MTQVDGTTNLVWWIPTEFWVETLRSNSQVTEDQRNEFVAVLKDYSAFVIVNMQAGVLGGMTFKNREEILENVTLTVDGSEVEPLPVEELNSDARNFFAMMKPMMGQVLGQFGQGMEFIVYPNKKDEALIINAMEEGSFTYTCFGEEHVWRLPLGSLLPPVWDPKTQEVFPGNYKFNPYTGSELSNKEEPSEDKES